MRLSCWVAVAAGSGLAGGWLGYPVALRFLFRKRPIAPGSAGEAEAGSLGVVIATRDAPDLIRARLLDVRSGAPGRAPLDIVVGVDRAGPHALAEYERTCGELGRFVAGDAPGGKACTLNAAVRASTSPLLVFTDSRQEFARDAIARLVLPFSDPQVGGVTGTLRLADEAPTSALLRVFWAYELVLRRLESAVRGVVAVTGAIHALRRELWVPLPPGFICDDLFIPMQAARRGYRVVASAESIALDRRSFTRGEEFRRKVRTLTGMIQFCLACPWALNPFQNPLWWQFVCHKLLRLATPYLLALGSAAALHCAGASLAGTLVGLLLAALLLGLLALVPRTAALQRLYSQVLSAGYLLAAPVVATLHAVRGDWDVWKSRKDLERP